MKQFKTEHAWINIEDQLPPVNKKVLLFNAFDELVTTGFLRSDGQWNDLVSGLIRKTRITHWTEFHGF